MTQNSSNLEFSLSSLFAILSQAWAFSPFFCVAVLSLLFMKGIKIATSMCNCGNTNQSENYYYGEDKEKDGTDEKKKKEA